MGEDLTPIEMVAVTARDVAKLADRLAFDVAELAAYPHAGLAGEVLAQVHEVSMLTSEMLMAAVRHERQRGSSWEAIASVLGASRETIRQRFATAKDGSSAGADPRRPPRSRASGDWPFP